VHLIALELLGGCMLTHLISHFLSVSLLLINFVVAHGLPKK